MLHLAGLAALSQAPKSYHVIMIFIELLYLFWVFPLIWQWELVEKFFRL